MRKTFFRNVCTFFLVIITLFASSAYTYAATGRQLAESAIAALKASAPTTTTRNVPTFNWSWFELNYSDETYPLTVDFVGSNFQCAQKVVYLLPGGGVNFRSSFFTPVDDNLAQFFRKAGYLVVGITPREDNVPSAPSYGCMADWGLHKHTSDIRKIIGIVQAKLRLPYRVVGHSFGAAYALDYAGYPVCGLEKIIALDIYSFAPDDAEDVDNSDISYTAFLDLMGQGEYADSSYSDIKSLMLISMLFPDIDSGESREGLGLPGNFTFEGLLYFSMIFSADLPGIHTPLTGLAGDWPLVQSYAAGEYAFAEIPQNDQYRLTCSSMSTLREASFKVGSGLVPSALYRDFFAVNAYNGECSINWAGINKPVLWVNTELGYGSNIYGATLIRNSGNSNVLVAVVPGYGHLDILSGRNAKVDVWGWFL